MNKPFDLQKAMQGEPIVTRDGREAFFIAFEPKAVAPLVVRVGDVINTYFENGLFYKDTPSYRDILMKEELFDSVPVSFPEPLREPPEEGTHCYATSPLSDLKWYFIKWENEIYCMDILERGMLHKTKENAILHANALIEASGGKNE